MVTQRTAVYYLIFQGWVGGLWYFVCFIAPTLRGNVAHFPEEGQLQQACASHPDYAVRHCVYVAVTVCVADASHPDYAVRHCVYVAVTVCVCV